VENLSQFFSPLKLLVPQFIYIATPFIV